MSRIRPPTRLAANIGPQQGFTAIEMMVVVAIVAVLASLAAPSFTTLIERWRVRQTVEGMQSTLYYARSEAIRRGGGVFMQKLPKNSNGCPLGENNGDWDCGWVVFADANGNKTWDADEELQIFIPPANITVTRTSNKATIGIDRWGMMDGVNALGFSISPHPKGITSPAALGICMASGGRIRVISQTEIPCS